MTTATVFGAVEPETIALPVKLVVDAGPLVASPLTVEFDNMSMSPLDPMLPLSFAQASLPDPLTCCEA